MKKIILVSLVICCLCGCSLLDNFNKSEDNLTLIYNKHVYEEVKNSWNPIGKVNGKITAQINYSNDGSKSNEAIYADTFSQDPNTLFLQYHGLLGDVLFHKSSNKLPDYHSKNEVDKIILKNNKNSEVKIEGYKKDEFIDFINKCDKNLEKSTIEKRKFEEASVYIFIDFKDYPANFYFGEIGHTISGNLGFSSSEIKGFNYNYAGSYIVFDRLMQNYISIKLK